MKEYNFKEYNLSNDERLWLNELYKQNWDIVDPRSLKVNLYNKLSPGFDSTKIYIKLVSFNRLTLLGLWYIDSDNYLIRQTGLIIETVRDIIKKDNKLDSIDSKTVSSLINISENDVKIIFTFLFNLGFCTGGSGSPTFNTITFGNESTSYDKFLNFINIEETLEDYFNDFRPSSSSTSLPLISSTVINNNAPIKEDIWKQIFDEYGITKRSFGKKINFVKDKRKRNIIFRDVEDAYKLVKSGFAKPAIILAGGIIEELLHSFILFKGITPPTDKFFSYVETCEKNNLLNIGANRLSDSARYFRNLVHIEREFTSNTSPSLSMASNVVSAIFIIVNEF